MNKNMNILQKLKNLGNDLKSEISVLLFSLSFILVMIVGALGFVFPTSLLVYFLLIFSVSAFIVSLFAISDAD